jgi:hypothetical protein
VAPQTTPTTLAALPVPTSVDPPPDTTVAPPAPDAPTVTTEVQAALRQVLPASSSPSGDHSQKYLVLGLTLIAIAVGGAVAGWRLGPR